MNPATVETPAPQVAPRRPDERPEQEATPRPAATPDVSSPRTDGNRKQTGRLLLLLALALALRLAWMIHAQPTPVSDFQEHRLLAAGLLDAHQFGVPHPTAYRLPGYPLLLALAMLASRSAVWLAVINIILSSLLVLVTYGLAWRLTGGQRRVAWIAGLWCALNPDFITFAPILASEHLSTPLVGLAIAASWHDGTRPLRRAALAGLLIGLAALTRGEALLFLPLLVILGMHATRGRRLALAGLVTCMLVAALIIAPWWMRNRLLFGAGAGLSTSAGTNFYHAHNGAYYGWRPQEETPLAGLDEVAAHRAGFALGRKRLAEHPSALWLDLARGTVRHYWPSPYGVIWSVLRHDESGWSAADLTGRGLIELLIKIFFFSTFFLAGISLMLIRRYPIPTWLALYGLIGINWLCYCVIFWGKARYRFTAELAMGVLAAMVVARWRERSARPQASAARV